MSAFLAMGGHAWFVWMAYGAVAVVVVAETIAVRARVRRARAAARGAGVPAEAPGARFDPARMT
jgi:heme exporter protein CcmD